MSPFCVGNVLCITYITRGDTGITDISTKSKEYSEPIEVVIHREILNI